MNTQLIFVHGIAQHEKNSEELKKNWIDALEKGLQKNDLTMPITDEDIHFPYYGNTLYQLTKGIPQDLVSEVIVRGDFVQDPNEYEFITKYLEEIRNQFNISDEQVDELFDGNHIDRAPQNWRWVQAIIRAIDKNIDGASGKAISIFIKVVYQYLNNNAVMKIIDDGVSKALKENRNTVVIGHSLGSVVTYNILKNRAERNNWNISLIMTLGSPLAIRGVRDSLAPIGYPAMAKNWFNARDPRDVVALYPLDNNNFEVAPEIENYSQVENNTSNCHGIVGYLDDATVAKRIYDALTT